MSLGNQRMCTDTLHMASYNRFALCIHLQIFYKQHTKNTYMYIHPNLSLLYFGLKSVKIIYLLLDHLPLAPKSYLSHICDPLGENQPYAPLA